ncbi:STAS-like domain-containing protein [Marinobacter sp.]|uniref:STAS-like domain-containing protein n=1 Tax=Marinobacter sp. TaxID=50741 RepID=UPI001B6ABA0A|nr:STAS-like domain-containing protein [Marinobacter sp.]MBQ0832004.1 STAS-like domain-containing protein [Marinobacter sp.]
MKTIRVKDFAEFPGPRYKKLGPCSGEEFRETVLKPAIIEAGADIQIDLDGAFGYGSSFLEEAFGGLVRLHIINADQARKLSAHIKSDEDPTLAEEVKSYLVDAVKGLEPNSP